jgi:hypothetical protein
VRIGKVKTRMSRKSGLFMVNTYNFLSTYSSTRASPEHDSETFGSPFASPDYSATKQFRDKWKRSLISLLI